MVTKIVIENERVRRPIPVLPPGILWNDFVFVLGIGGLDKTRKPVSTDITQQTFRAMERIKEVLDAENFSFNNVVRSWVALTDATDFEVVNNTYREITGEDIPACIFTEVTCCPIPGEDVKIQVFAHRIGRRLIQTDRAPALIPYRPQAIEAGGLFFVQSMNGVDVSTGRLVSEDVVRQAEKTLDNISGVLKSGSLNPENIVKATIFMTDLDEIDKVIKVYEEYIDFLSPCFLQVPRISTWDEKIMIEVIASTNIQRRLKVDKVPAYREVMAQGVLTDDFIFVQGMGGIDVDSRKPISKNILRQTEKALENIDEVLKEGGMTLANAVSASVFLTDMKQYANMNEVYGMYMGNQPPARICVEVPQIFNDSDILIEVIAAR